MASLEGATDAPGKTKYQPSEFLKSVLGRPVVVKLNSGVDYRGVLACLDGYMNIAMEQTEEYVNGQLKAKYGDCFIRGNNGALPMLTYPLSAVAATLFAWTLRASCRVPTSPVCCYAALFPVLYISAAKRRA